MGGLSSLAIRSLAARRGRTVLSVVGIALGIAVLHASLATDAGIAASTDRTVSSASVVRLKYVRYVVG